MSENHLSRLYLFAKDTDATDAIRGYKYQELKTLETWLFNKVKGISENIYCDYEEDIFQRNLKEFKSTFTQLKLYSSKNFSFSSIEIRKCISHFFMLFVKGAYLEDTPTFVFETNTSIAASKGDNDAELLRDWAKHQEKLPDELLTKCISKIKSIVDEYINAQMPTSSKGEPQEDYRLAKDIYENLSTDTWQKFVRSIKWVFQGITTDEAVDLSIRNSMGLIAQLPFPIESEDYSRVFDRLRGEVSDKSMTASPENRVLTNDLLNLQLLRLGDKDDRAYEAAYRLWSDAPRMKEFSIGEFYQILFAAKHCRRSSYLSEHSQFWIGLLRKVTDSDILTQLKRSAIYELVWIALRPAKSGQPKGNLNGLEELVKFYFSDFEQYRDILSIEDLQNLATVVEASQRMGLIQLDTKLVDAWRERIRSFLIECKANAEDRNSYCRLLEIEAFRHMNEGDSDSSAEGFKRSMVLFEEIIRELPSAPLFSVSQLGRRIDEIIKISIQHSLDDRVKALEDYSERLLPFVKEREGNFSVAKSYIQKGVHYIESEKPSNMLRGLDYFHKAKDLYLEDSTFEGFVLGLINIAQVYSAIGMNLAAKYYGLLAIWACQNNGDPKLLKRIPDSAALLFYFDFKQGAWMTALADFEFYIASRTELSTKSFDPESDELLLKTLLSAAFILALAPMISPQVKLFIDSEKGRMGSLHTDYLKSQIDLVDKELAKVKLIELVARKVDSAPIDDVGAVRVITWAALGIDWRIEFRNDYLNNSIGEEFAALIQIIQVELAMRQTDLKLTKGAVTMVVELTDRRRVPEQMPSNSEYKWKVYLPRLEAKEPAEKSKHYTEITAAFCTVLNEMSLMPSKELLEFLQGFFKSGLETKALTVNAYQKAYRELYSEKKFSSSMRDKFKSETIKVELHKSSVMENNFEVSPNYSREKALQHIRNRYGVYRKTIYLTVKRIQNSKEFVSALDRLRKAGWLDWQIAMAFYNNLINQKAHNAIRQSGKEFQREELFIEELQDRFQEIHLKDESETYVEVPLDILLGKELDFQLQQVPVHVLRSFGLESKSRFPNSEAVREFLNRRFKFAVDDIPEESPFRNITLK